MITQQMIDALEAATDVAYEGAPSDDKERIEMEGHARQGLSYLKDLYNVPRPSASRWYILSNSLKSAYIVQAVKSVMAKSTANRKVVIMPEEDYTRMTARILHLERRHIADAEVITKLNQNLHNAYETSPSAPGEEVTTDAG